MLLNIINGRTIGCDTCHFEIDPDCDASVDADEGDKDKAEHPDEALGEDIADLGELLEIREN